MLCIKINKIIIFSFLFISLINKLNGDNNLINVHKRFEYKYSFKPPYLAQKDGTVPFWEYGGNAIASSENVRVAPSLRSQKGAVWTKSKTDFEWWEVEVLFRVTGRGRIGADGLAFWYTEERGDYAGNVFGSSDQWKGLGLFFDSFDNDNKHNNPYIMAVLNDGTKLFDHQNDGSTQSLAGCLRDFRNKPFPTRAKIEYYKNILTVWFHNGMSTDLAAYEVCLRAENVVLPKSGYFGVSAATGGLADDHDILHFLTTSLYEPGQLHETNKIGDDSEKLAKEYKEYQDKLDKRKEEYRKEHPEANKDEDPDDWFESDNQRELRQIFQAQSQISDTMRELSRKIDEIIGRQERTLSLISASPQHPGQPHIQGQPIATTGTITRLEVDSLLTNQNTLTTLLRDTEARMIKIQSTVDHISQPNYQKQVQDSNMDHVINEVRDSLNQVKLGMSHVGQKITGCPTCVSTTMFFITTFAHVFILIIYQVYRSRSESQSKKFY